LKAARNRADDWPLDHAGWSLVGPGVRRVYRSGRQTLETVRQKPIDGNLHELRKQAKYLWQQLEMLAPIAPVLIRDLAEQAHQPPTRSAPITTWRC
jgi:CHAD domain-containing protein